MGRSYCQGFCESQWQPGPREEHRKGLERCQAPRDRFWQDFMGVLLEWCLMWTAGRVWVALLEVTMWRWCCSESITVGTQNWPIVKSYCVQLWSGGQSLNSEFVPYWGCFPREERFLFWPSQRCQTGPAETFAMLSLTQGMLWSANQSADRFFSTGDSWEEGKGWVGPRKCRKALYSKWTLEEEWADREFCVKISALRKVG